MSFLITHMFICLLAATLFGVIIGWFLKSCCLRDFTKEKEKYLKDIENLNLQIELLKEEKENNFKISEVVLNEYKDRISALENKRVVLESKIFNLSSQLQEKKEQLKKSLNLNAKLQNMLNECKEKLKNLR
jgi:chromosome segregation ATPase